MEILVKNLKKTFGEKTAVDIPQFTVNDGDILGLVGNNGAGKTTLFRLMLDLLNADAGCVEYVVDSTGSDGTATTTTINPADSEEWKHSVGAYIDDGFLIDFLTPEEYFDFVGKVSGLTHDTIVERLAAYERFMAGEILGQKKLIRDFSAGNKQKIGIISALLVQPRIVILDEPFNFLDPSSQHVLKSIITTYAAEHHATMLISSHNLQHTVEVSTRVALLEKGAIAGDFDNHDGSAEAQLEDYFNIDTP